MWPDAERRHVSGRGEREPLDRAARKTPFWEIAVLVGAVVASVAALWVTLSADFLTYPGWLAVQKADFILGPVLAGLYWYRRRPQSRFGPMLIGFGFIGALYILQSASNSWLFSIGLLAEIVIGLATRVLILAFPTGRPSKTRESHCGSEYWLTMMTPMSGRAVARRSAMRTPSSVPVGRIRTSVTTTSGRVSAIA